MQSALINTEPFQKLKIFLESESNIIFTLIFGSVATGNLTKESDIDIGIYFKQPPEGLDLLNLINRLSNLAGRNVDVVVLNNASVFLRHQIMKNKIILMVKDRAVYTKFREKTLSDYDEYMYISGLYIYDR